MPSELQHEYIVTFYDPDKNDYIRVEGLDSRSDAEAFFTLIQDEGFNPTSVIRKYAFDATNISGTEYYIGEEEDLTGSMIITDAIRPEILEQARSNPALADRMNILKQQHESAWRISVQYNERDGRVDPSLFITERQREQAERMAAKWEARALEFWQRDANGNDPGEWGHSTAGYCKTAEDAERAEVTANRIQEAISRLLYKEGTHNDVLVIQAAVAGRDALDAEIQVIRDAEGRAAGESNHESPHGEDLVADRQVQESYKVSLLEYEGDNVYSAGVFHNQEDAIALAALLSRNVFGKEPVGLAGAYIVGQGHGDYLPINITSEEAAQNAVAMSAYERFMSDYEAGVLRDEYDAQEPIGTITYHASGETASYTDAGAYLEDIENNFDTLGINGWSYNTVSDDPALNKSVGNLVRSAFGEPINDTPQTQVSEPDGGKRKEEILAERLAQGVRDLMDSDSFKDYLATSGRLYYNKYSFRNAMLMYLQKPDASYVMGYEQWKSFGRNVRQGATGASIFMPVLASEKTKGGLYAQIMRNLNDQLSKEPSAPVVSYRLGQSNIEFTMNRANRLCGLKMNGAERGVFNSPEEMKQFIDRSILGKTPMYFNAGTVFDAHDVTVPDYLWVKSGFSSDEVVRDENGKPIVNKRGETKIVNTPERQARFNPVLQTGIVAQDPIKMATLLDVCVSASERKGVPVYFRDKSTDEGLHDGAKGYFRRRFSESTPNGFIVIDKNLEITEQCAVMFHEMGHADLHKNLKALAERMGEEKVPREMREIQAEAVAFMTATNFGITTDTSSFAYLATFSNGYEMQDFQKSLEVIYKECQALMDDLRVELDIRGLNLDLTEKPITPLEKSTIDTLSQKYLTSALADGDKVSSALGELPALVAQNKRNPGIMDVLKAQKRNLDLRTESVDLIVSYVDSLKTVGTRNEQDSIIARLDAANTRLLQGVAAFDVLTEQFMHVKGEIEGGLKADFEKAPKATLDKMKKEFPRLAELTEAQLKYIAKSGIVARDYSKLLKTDPNSFVDRVCDLAAIVGNCASKNGTFVEISFCEQWTDKPVFENGSLFHPKVAESIFKQAEIQIRGLRTEAESVGEYFPCVKCNTTVFSPTAAGKGLSAYAAKIDIGDGSQTGLTDYLQQSCGRGKTQNEIVQNVLAALKERGVNDKIYIPSHHSDDAADQKHAAHSAKTSNAWDMDISQAKEQARTDAAKDEGGNQDSAKDITACKRDIRA